MYRSGEISNETGILGVNNLMNKNKKINSSFNLVKVNPLKSHSNVEVEAELSKRFQHAERFSKEPFTEKKLVYFTINYNISYLFLFLYCLRSLNKSHDAGCKYDVLIICPAVMEKMINDLIDEYGVRLRCDNLYFHHVPVAADGVEASMNKLKVYGWERIKEYGKVLFLDVDIVFNRCVDELFKLDLKPGILHAGIHMQSMHLHNTVFHKLVNKYTEEELQVFNEKGIYAFNAGQFMFINSESMLRHMYNVSWLSRAWNGPYFFEQAFMNHYFNRYLISDVTLLNDRIKFMPVQLEGDVFNSVNSDTVFIHFTGEACNAQAKMKFIRKHFSGLI